MTSFVIGFRYKLYCLPCNAIGQLTLRERQIKLREDALVLQEQMTEFRNNVVKEVLAIFPKGESMC